MARDYEIQSDNDLSKSDERGSGTGLIWFLAGAAAGAALALLYAPHEGERTRRILKQKVRKGRDLVADQGRDLMDKGTDLYRKGRDVAEDAADMFEHGRNLAERKMRG